MIRTTGEQKNYLCLKLDGKTDDQSTCGWQQCHLIYEDILVFFYEVPYPSVPCATLHLRK